jgi:uncharacterized C2H2 Zn-finger protein
VYCIFSIELVSSAQRAASTSAETATGEIFLTCPHQDMVARYKRQGAESHVVSKDAMIRNV